MKMAQVWVVARVDAVCELSQESMLALSPCLVLSKGIGWPFGRCVKVQWP